MLVKDETVGCISSKISKKKLSTPHSVSMIDLDGDCMSDLFLTITDKNTGKSYYEIYHRREYEDNDDSEISQEMDIPGIHSFCLI